jgi:hypothetical protein
MPHATTRRRFLATTAAVPGALALPAIGAPTNADDELLQAFARWYVAFDIPDEADEDDGPEAVAESWRLYGRLADLVPETAEGVIVKLSFLIFQMLDHYGHRDPNHGSARAAKALEAATTHFPAAVSDAIALATRYSLEAMRRWSDDSKRAFANQGMASRWERIE